MGDTNQHDLTCHGRLMVFLRTNVHTVFPGAAGSVYCINRVTYYTWDIWADTAPVLMGSAAPFGERKPNTEKKQKKEAMGWHHLLIEPRRGQMLLQRDPRKLSWVCSQCKSNCHLQKWERLGPECLKSPVKKVSLWRKQMANSLLVGNWPTNTRRTHHFLLNIKAINDATEHVLI